METNTGPGTADAQSGDLAVLRRQFAAFGEVQARHSRSLDILTGQMISDDGLLVSLNREMIALRDDVTVLDVKFDELKAGVSELKSDMAEVKGSLKEILNRLPAKAA